MNKKWTDEAILAEAGRYPSRIAWKRASGRSYRLACQRGLLDMIEIQSNHIQWTKELVIQEIRKYNCRSEWKANSPGSFKAAKRFGLDDTANLLLPDKRGIQWDKTGVISCAQQCNSKRELLKRFPGIKLAAKRLGIWNDITAHMTRPVSHRLYWTAERVLEDAQRFTTRSEWWTNSRSAYYASKRLGIFEKAVSHMASSSGMSQNEFNLLQIIQQKYPKAHRARFGRITKGQYGQQFELDIYIPELRKGIEFNGKYWHSDEGIRRGRPNWTDITAEKYHTLKRDFFTRKNIAYIEIAENNWIERNDECLARIKTFLSEE